MNKIEVLALKASTANLSEEQLKALDLIFEATGNAQACIELFLGIYEYPQFAQNSNVSKYKINCKFISFDPIANTVKYSYNRLSSSNVWLPKEAVASEVKLEDYREAHPELFDYYCFQTQGKTEKEWQEVYKRTNIYGNASSETEIDTISYNTWMDNATK